jgi:hypothetical protein
VTRIGSLFIFVIFFLSFAFAQAAGVTVQSSVDRNEMAVGDTFTVTISVVSNDSVDIQEPRVPDLAGFQLLNSWQSSAVAQKLVNTGSGMQFETQRR